MPELKLLALNRQYFCNCVDLCHWYHERMPWHGTHGACAAAPIKKHLEHFDVAPNLDYLTGKTGNS